MKILNDLNTTRNFLLQELSVAYLFMMFYFGPILSTILSIYILCYTSYYPIVLAYFFWIFIDRETCLYDGRRLKCVRNMGLWKYFKEYFPHRLVKTAELPQEKNYILCTFPHGLMCSAAFAQYGWDQSDFAMAFPGITVTGHTLNTNFYFPFTREFALSLGLCSVSKKALFYQLNKPGGHAVNLVIGGSAEAMKSTPGVYRLVLKSRKGFVKLALTTGASLVPVFAFGEVDLYKQWIFPEDSKFHKLQQIIRKWTGIAPCLFYGRGPLGLFPLREPVTVVVGKPIPVEKKENPTKEEIDELHKKFVDDVIGIFEEHKHKYVKNFETTFLSIED